MLSKTIVKATPEVLALNTAEIYSSHPLLKYLQKSAKNYPTGRLGVSQGMQKGEMGGVSTIGANAQQLHDQRPGQKEVNALPMLIEKSLSQADMVQNGLTDEAGNPLSEMKARALMRNACQRSIEARLEHAIAEQGSLGTITQVAGVDAIDPGVDMNVTGHTILTTVAVSWLAAGSDVYGDLAGILDTLNENGIDEVIAFYNNTTGKTIRTAITGDWGAMDEGIKSDLMYGRPGQVPRGWQGLDWQKHAGRWGKISGTPLVHAGLPFLTDNVIYFMPRDSRKAWVLARVVDPSTGRVGYGVNSGGGVKSGEKKPYKYWEQISYYGIPILVNPMCVKALKIIP